MSDLFLKVAVEAPLSEPLTYGPPPPAPDCANVSRGDSVLVPLGKRFVKGVVMGETPDKGAFALKPVREHLLDRPRIPDSVLRWLEWLSSYYMHPIGQIVSMAFPPLKKVDPKKQRASKKGPIVPQVAFTEPPTLTSEQETCFKAISDNSGFGVHLLHGVTGSGKTEVYLRLLAEVLERGQVGLVLVPEISLTPQLIQRFSSRFGDKVAVLHSHLTEREKTNQWWTVIDGEKSILVGARSALFCPIENLGLIIIDEEHEPSFKQDEKLKYHARDAAIMRAKFASCPIVLGSATPSLESWQNAREGRYKLHTMAHRVADRKMPTVEVVDLREERHQRKENPENVTLPFWLSETLFERMQETLRNGEQIALFLNRRGVAQLAMCPDCGHVFECPNCAISLTLHGDSHLVCHYCDFSQRMSEKCPQCPQGEVRPLGLGTELVEKDVQQLFPEARLARADRDEIQGREDLEDLISDVEHRRVDILIGTQMIAKGLDFPGLTLVGLVLADVGFNMPDFRATERSFQLLTQVGGRSGRHSKDPGKVVVQTYNPEHLSLRYMMQNDFDGFADQELTYRRELDYPPFGRLALLKIQGMGFEKAQLAAHRLGQRAMALRDHRPEYETISPLGPAPAPIAKLRGKYRFQMLLKSPTPQLLNAFCKQLLGDQKWIPPGTKVQVDVDPMNML